MYLRTYIFNFFVFCFYLFFKLSGDRGAASEYIITKCTVGDGRSHAGTNSSASVRISTSSRSRRSSSCCWDYDDDDDDDDFTTTTTTTTTSPTVQNRRLGS